MLCTRAGFAHQGVYRPRQRLLALFRVIAQRLQVPPAQTCKLIQEKVAVEGREAALAAAERQDGGQLLQAGSLEPLGDGLSRCQPLRSTSDHVTPLPATPCYTDACIPGNAATPRWGVHVPKAGLATRLRGLPRQLYDDSPPGAPQRFRLGHVACGQRCPRSTRSGGAPLKGHQAECQRHAQQCHDQLLP